MLKKPRVVRLHPSNPHAALDAPARKPRPAQRSGPLKLTEEQRKNPLIRNALPRLQSISTTYRGRYLRRLDTVHGGRRTRLEVFQALELVAEPMLVRLDWATGVLGYFDMDDGRFVLNTQCNVAEDAGITPQRMSRFIGTLAAAGYAYQRSERIRLDEKGEDGLHLVRTRVMVRLTRNFWNDLGLQYIYERVQKAAKKRRAAELIEVDLRRQAELEQRSLEELKREISRQRWRAKESAKAGTAAPASEASITHAELAPEREIAPEKIAGNDMLAELRKKLAKKPVDSG
ncbi:hypothetical protein HDC30_005750 [Pseudomonas sp. JAI115]|uniref:hypothetical protein n=1 Tax=Pseudomonas sp. JAI115 TaxID=2723061 RepID=UPI00161BE51E|nr:hypothetical protein [Pseudomonas sp. JAI115]MBB6158492.1 hypothetical protein [Pseudomonas sp. JAI115]